MSVSSKPLSVYKESYAKDSFFVLTFVILKHKEISVEICLFLR